MSNFLLFSSALEATISEPGNTLETAFDLGSLSYDYGPPLGLPILRSYADYVGADDSADYFKFVLTSESGIYLNLNAPSNTTVRILDSEGSEIASETLPIYNSYGSLQQNLEAGTYYLHWLTSNETASYYNFNLLAGVPDGSGDYETPEDLGSLTATPVSRNDYVFYYYGSGNSFSDSDVYQFTLSETSTVNFSLTDDAQSSTYLSVSSISGSVSLVNLNNNLSETNASAQQTLAAGTYLLYLSGNGAFDIASSQSRPTAYTLSLSAQPATVLEPGDTLETAFDLGSLSYDYGPPLGLPIIESYADYVGADDSADYFKFVLTSGGGVYLNYNSPSNTTVRLLDGEGNEIASETSQYSSYGNLQQNLEAGTYYLHWLTSNETASYYNFNLLTGVPDDIGDYDSPEDLGTLTATPISRSDYVFYYYGGGSSFSDSDVYQFTLSETSAVSFSLTDDAQA
ncbi:MAG: hypothetical protein VKN60_08335, partial [Cyanobacteriota bacterium]|nr:hypothetical protein [Cyanobacteriota bacterium]